MTKYYRVPLEILVEVEDDNEFAAHVLDRGGLDSAEFQGAWYLPGDDERGEFFNDLARLDSALEAVADWLIRFGLNTVPREQSAVWRMSTWRHPRRPEDVVDKNRW